MTQILLKEVIKLGVLMKVIGKLDKGMTFILGWLLVIVMILFSIVMIIGGICVIVHIIKAAINGEDIDLFF
jgi:hypothetical protein